MPVVDLLRENWAVISAAPWAFVAIAAAFLLMGFAAGRFFLSERISSLEGRIALKDDRIADYEAKLQGATPDEAKAKIEALERRLGVLEPRVIDASQENRIKSALAKKPGSVAIDRDTVSLRSKRLQMQLINAFEDAGWTVHYSETLGLDDLPVTGIGVRARVDELAAKEAAAFVMSAFQAASLECEAMEGFYTRAAPAPIEIVLADPEG